MTNSDPSSQETAFFDLQVNGYGGVDFNADKLQTEDVSRVCRQLQGDGVSGILATVITADLVAMCRRLQNICRVREQDAVIRKVIRGIHIEGPFISALPGYVGAHPAAHVLPAHVDAMQQLLDAAEGLTRIVTLAPECDADSSVTLLLANLGITVSAGHSNPDIETLKSSLDAGLSMVTHLGNGCPLLLPRHDNIIQRLLSLSERLAIGFIADGVHIPYPTLGNYLRVTGFERAFVVTDAIAAAGQGPGVFRLGDRQVVVDHNLATWSEDRQHLVGSALTMPSAVNGLRQHLGLTQAQIDRLTRRNPRLAIGENTVTS